LQYYVLIGLLFPLVVSDRRVVRDGLLVGLTAVALVLPHIHGQIFKLLPTFVVGIAAFQHLSGRMTAAFFAVVLAASGIAGFFTMDAYYAAATVLAGGAIVLVRLSMPQTLLFFGAISYSLYLVHAPIGAALLGLGRHLPASLAIDAAVILLAGLVSLAVAYAFYRWIEMPATAWSKLIRYRAPGARTASAEPRPSGVAP
jgi:peptidoglycan/LPS O-acetylase OafA/YrhL